MTHVSAFENGGHKILGIFSKQFIHDKNSTYSPKSLSHWLGTVVQNTLNSESFSFSIYVSAAFVSITLPQWSHSLCVPHSLSLFVISLFLFFVVAKLVSLCCDTIVLVNIFVTCYCCWMDSDHLNGIGLVGEYTSYQLDRVKSTHNLYSLS